MKRLLLQACSQRKITAPDQLPAIERYDGVSYRVIKKYLRENPNAAAELTILILSAEFGLIASTEMIPDYNRRMDKTRADELQNPVLNAWQNIVGNRIFSDIFINVGADYLPALKLISLPIETKYAGGGIGERNGQLKRWLRQ